MIKLGRLAFLRNPKDRASQFSLKIPSDIKHIKEVSFKILNAVSKYEVAEDKIFDMRLCIEEAVRNAIVHGNNSVRKLTVKIDCRVDEDGAVIEIEDKGKGFDPRAVPDPTKEENVGKNSGRGVYLIHKLMDKVEYSERGNRIIMTKRFK